MRIDTNVALTVAELRALILGADDTATIDLFLDVPTHGHARHERLVLDVPPVPFERMDDDALRIPENDPPRGLIDSGDPAWVLDNVRCDQRLFHRSLRLVGGCRLSAPFPHLFQEKNPR